MTADGELVIAQRLFSSDLRILACRRVGDPREPGCAKIRVRANGRAFWLCRSRVSAFFVGGSLAGIECEP